MKNNLLVKVPGLKADEQRRFIFSNLKDNISRLKLAGLVFLIIEIIMLAWLLLGGIINPANPADSTILFLYAGIILFLSIYLLFFVYVSKKAKIKNMTFIRLFIITGLMLVLIWGVFLVLFEHTEGFLPSAYILIMMSIGIIPYLNFWEISVTMIPSQILITLYVVTTRSFNYTASTNILFDSWSFCLISILISTLIYKMRISNYKKDIMLLEQNDMLKQHSEIDALTGIYNRRKLDEELENEWQRSSRSQKPLSFLLIDLDHFKKYNDTYGHMEGDICLKKAATVMAETLKRSTDVIFRYGGEEFAAILPFTSLDAACLVGEKLRKNIENAQIEHVNSSTGYLTVSIGVSSAIGNHEKSPEKLCLEADKALYAAKKSGRNKVICYDD
ncbi:MAG: diguanylate cyclase [Clostridia bacterium]|nr:diguanylate cyclase [Clostridia bacterium]MBN2883076.1 diguanylate cyclase [Clostridia bacterium]